MPIISPSGSGGSGAISGVTVTGTAASGQVPVASSSSAGVWGYPPGFEIGYDQITATVNVVSTTEATGTTIITCAAHTFDGGAVMAQFFAPAITTGTTSGNQVIVSIFESTTQIARVALVNTPAATNAAISQSGFLRFTPSAASHTYIISAFTLNVTGTPTVTCGAGGTGAYGPCFVRFTKV